MLKKNKRVFSILIYLYKALGQTEIFYGDRNQNYDWGSHTAEGNLCSDENIRHLDRGVSYYVDVSICQNSSNSNS